MVFRVGFGDIGKESAKLRKVEISDAMAAERQTALEVMIDENFFNAILASLYNEDYSFDL